LFYSQTYDGKFHMLIVSRWVLVVYLEVSCFCFMCW